jgi:hypothetical protein
MTNSYLTKNFFKFSQLIKINSKNEFFKNNVCQRCIHSGECNEFDDSGNDRQWNFFEIFYDKERNVIEIYVNIAGNEFGFYKLKKKKL